MDLPFPSHIVRPDINVRVWTETAKGAVADFREGHNVMTDKGREWLRDLACAVAYPSLGTDTDGLSGDYTRTDHRVRYIGVGSGGVFASGGTQRELASVETLESPLIAYNDGVDHYLRTVAGQGYDASTDIIPSATVARYIRHFGFREINDIGAQGATVLVSEMGLFTTAAVHTAAVATPAVAYFPFTPLSKSEAVVLKCVWELVW